MTLFDVFAGQERASAEEFGRLARYLRCFAEEQAERARLRSDRVGQVRAHADRIDAASSSPRLAAVTERIRRASAAGDQVRGDVDGLVNAVAHLADIAARTAAVIAEVEQFERSWTDQLKAGAQEWTGRLAAAGGEALGIVDQGTGDALAEQYREDARRAEEAAGRREQAMADWRRECGAVVAAMQAATATVAGRATTDLGVVAPRGSVRPPVDQHKVDTALATVHSSLDPGGFGVREDDLDRIRDTLEGLNSAEVDAVIAGMSDEELARWFDQMGDSWIKGGWPEDRRRELLVMIGEKDSIDTWRRLARFTRDIDPPPSEGGGDSATGDPATRDYFNSLRYEYIETPLTIGPGNGYSIGDIQQGAIGDCYLIAAIKGIALRDPDALARMIKANPNGSYTVTFGDGTQVVVTSDLVMEQQGTLAFAKNRVGGPTSELWPLILEKAYTQRYGGWGETAGGFQNQAVEQLTGRKADSIPAEKVDIHDLAGRWRKGQILGISSLPARGNLEEQKRWLNEQAPAPYRRPDGSDGQKLALVTGHAFVVTNVDEAAGTVTVKNPWYPDGADIVLTESELRESISRVEANSAP